MSSECIHDYVPVLQTKDGLQEVCRICKKRLVTRFDDKGRNPPLYLKEHIRDTAQPTGATSKIFARAYGKPKK